MTNKDKAIEKLEGALEAFKDCQDNDFSVREMCADDRNAIQSALTALIEHYKGETDGADYCQLTNDLLGEHTGMMITDITETITVKPDTLLQIIKSARTTALDKLLEDLG